MNGRDELTGPAALKFAEVLAAIAFSATALSAAGPVTFVKTYANQILNTTQQKDVTPYGVQATSDGGYILLASTNCTTEACIQAQGNTNPLVNWLVKTDSAGNPQWQKELGCFSVLADNTIGTSVQQTADGGYIVGAGEYNYKSCGSGTAQRAIVEKLDSSGNLTWSKTYPIGSYGDGIAAIKQTADGGYVAVGGVYEVGPSPGGAWSSNLTLRETCSGSALLAPWGRLPSCLTPFSRPRTADP